MAGVASVVFDIRAGVARLTSDFARAESTIQSGMKRIQGVMRKATIALGAYVGVRAMQSLVTSTADAAGELTYMAQRTGASVEALSALKWGAEQSGASVGNLNRVLRNLAERAADTAAGGTQFAERYQRFGIALTDVNGAVRATDEVLADIADRLAEMPDGAAKTQAAMTLMGVNSGPMLLPMLSQGRKGLEEFRKEADRLGVTFSTDTAVSLEAFGTNLGRLRAVSGGFGRALVSGLAMPLEAVTDRMVEATSGGEKFAAIQRAAAVAGEVFLTVLDATWAALRMFVEAIGAAFHGVGGLNKALTTTGQVASDLDAGLHSLALVMRTLASVGRVVGWVFNVVGQAVAGVVGAVWYAIQGRFREAMEIATMSGWDMVDSTVDAWDGLRDTWTTSSREVVAQSREMGLGLSDALDAAKERAAQAGSAFRGIIPPLKDSSKEAARARQEWERLQRAIRDNALETDIIVAESLGQTVQVMRLQLQQQLVALDDMLRAQEITAEDHARRREALSRLTEQRITDHYREEQEKRRDAQQRAMEEMQREAEQAQRVGISIAESITQGLKDGFSGRGFRDVIRSLLTVFSRISALIPGGGLAGGVSGIFAGLFAKGGLIEGPGTGTSDSILARVSAGEFVATAEAVKRFGVDFFERLNQGIVDLGALPAYAGGGVVGDVSPAAPVRSAGGQAPVVYMQAFDPRSTAEAMKRIWEPIQYRRTQARQDALLMAGYRRAILPGRTGAV